MSPLMDDEWIDKVKVYISIYSYISIMKYSSDLKVKEILTHRLWTLC